MRMGRRRSSIQVSSFVLSDDALSEPFKRIKDLDDP
ncbi:hypothetical protein AgCh_037659, partial [Apium graveolens]